MLRYLRAAFLVALLVPIAILDFTTMRGSAGRAAARYWAPPTAESRTAARLSDSARRYLAVRPIGARGFLALAVAEDEGGDAGRAARLVGRAAALDPRLGAARYRLAGHYLATGQVAAGIDEIRVLQRLDGRRAEVMTPLLVELARARPYRLLMAQRFADDPNLLRLLEDGGRVGLEPDALLDLVSESDLRRMPRGVATAQTLISESYIRSGQFRRAWASWHALAGRRPSAAVFDGNFEGAEGAAPFGWTLTNNQYAQTRMHPREGPNGSGALGAEAYGSLPITVARQNLVLAQGRHLLHFATHAGGASESPFVWLVSCASGREVAEIALPPSPQWRSQTSELYVPADCPMQILALRKGPTPTDGPYRLLVSNLRIGPSRPESEPLAESGAR